MHWNEMNAGKKALVALFALLAILAVVNGVILLCESDPVQFYANLFH